MVFGIILPLKILGFDFLDHTIFMDTKDKGFLLPVAIVSVYVLGVFANQLADVFLQKTSIIMRLSKIKEVEQSFSTELGVSYHEALQKIVKQSQSAYEYLSYRRSVIRIIRTLFFITLLSIMIIIVLGIYKHFNSQQISYSNTIIYLSVCFFIFLFLRYRYIKLQIGYYGAIKNFFNNID